MSLEFEGKKKTAKSFKMQEKTGINMRHHIIELLAIKRYNCCNEKNK